MIPIIEKPENADCFDGFIVNLNDYSEEDQIEYWMKKAKSVKFMHDRFPDAFQVFVRIYGKEVAERVLALA